MKGKINNIFGASRHNYTLCFYKNIVYKNHEAQIAQNLRKF